MKRSPITVANEEVSIATVCRLLGVEVADESQRSMKLHCPFEETYHSDQGVEPAMRIYDETNHAYCFACSTSFTPVSMYAMAMDLRWREAAQALLVRVGVRPPDFETRWQQVQAFVPVPDRTQLAEALKTFCRRIDRDWRTRQFDETVAARLTECLSLLDLVVDDDGAGMWLSCCKEVMRHAIAT